MAQRKTLADQVAEQAIKINDMQAELAEHHGEFMALKLNHENAIRERESAREVVKKLDQNLLEKGDYIAELQGEVTRLKKELESVKSTNSYHSGRAEKAEAEIEQAHAALDAVPEALARDYDTDYGKKPRALSNRLVGTILAVVRATK